MSAPSLPTAADILDRFYSAERIYMSTPPSERDSSGMAATLSQDMKLYQSPDLPFGGVYEGINQFLQWGEAMAERFDVVDVMGPRVFQEKDGSGGNEVVVLGTLRLRVRTTGEEIANPFVQLVKVDREKGVIVQIRPFYWDVKGLNDALGSRK
jgi:hypothetical protein